MKSIWKKLIIKDVEYEVSMFGALRRLKPDGEYFYYKQNILPDGYAQRNGIHEHILVAMAFLGHKPNGHTYVVNHIDGNRQNNSLDNLEVITHSENILKSRKNKSSMYPFVSFDEKKGRYIVTMTTEGKQRYFGSFGKEDDAGKVSRLLMDIYREY